MTDAYFSETIDRLKESFLIAAAQGGNTQDCESLIEFGADVNWKNADGDTALLAATRRGHSDTISLLLAYGADSNIGGADSLTPLHISTRRGDAASVNILLDANTDPAVRTRDGQTALDIARAKGYENIYSRLMEKRGGIGRGPGNVAAAEGGSSALINNVRSELPAILQARSGSASGGNGSIASESRQLRNLGRLVHPPAERAESEGSTAASTLTTDQSRRRRADAAKSDRPADASGGAWATPVSNEARTKSEQSAKSHSAAAAAAAAADAAAPSPALERIARGAEAIVLNASGNSASSSSRAASEGSKAKTAAPSSSSARAPPGTNGAAAGNSYSIMGSAASITDAQGYGTGGMSAGGGGRGTAAGDETAVIALRRILDQEISSRKALEIKLAVFKDQNTQLLEEFASLSQQLTEMQDEHAQLELHAQRLTGEPAALDSVTIEECERLETVLKAALQKIDAKKTALIKSRVGGQNEQRMCVVCQENEKSVVLLPCRHLCLCAVCAEHDLLTMCPLCREAIVHKISVFS